MTIDNETLLLLNAWHDGELSPSEALSMERRIEREPELAALVRQFKELSSGLAGVLPGAPAPEHLRGAILSELSMDLTGDDDAATEDGADDKTLRPAKSSKTVHWPSIAATLVIGLVAGGLADRYAANIQQDDSRTARIERQMLTAHLRGLVAPRPFDIASSENHVVKPWFNGKTMIAPTVPDLAALGFPLAGGRVDVVEGKPVPAMIYRRREHTISVTVTTSDGQDADSSGTVDGVNVRRWTDGDLTYWAVSDLNPRELSTFADLYRKQLAASRG